MHYCLEVPEIFQRILDFVLVVLWEEGNLYGGYHQTAFSNAILGALARTCRLFLEPTLDALWRNQLTLGPLIRTLPEDAIEEVVQTTLYKDSMCDTTYHLKLKRPLGASDWTRFDYYAGRIRSLGHYLVEFADQDQSTWSLFSEGYCRRPVTRELLTSLSVYRRISTMLPRLRRLRWTVHDVSYTDYLPMFLGPNLTTLSIAVFQNNFGAKERASEEQYDRLVHVIANLDILCPSLTTFEMWTLQKPHIIDAALYFAFNCKNLEGFCVHLEREPPYSEDLLFHLATLESLRSAYLAFNEDTAAMDMSFLSPLHYPFPSLDSLYMTTPTLSSCTELIRAMHTCRLRIVSFEFFEHSDTLELYNLLLTLHDRCSHNTLQSLFIEDNCSPVGEFWLSPHTHYLTIDILHPLLMFPHMRALWIAMPLVGRLNDDDLAHIANTWPLLIDLQLLNHYRWYERPQITWAGVAYLTWNCPQLIELALAVDTAIDNVVKVCREPQFRPNRSLRFLDMLDSPLGDLEVAFRSIHAFAPLVLAVHGKERVDRSDEEEDASQGPLMDDPYAHYEALGTMLRRQASIDAGEMDPEQLPTWAETEMEEMNPWGSWSAPSAGGGYEPQAKKFVTDFAL
ncbi:hypothetical protein L226DRAFT_512047 [Lentinus tigrinus ALCF2SS1-7]|uniref:F-box domain-containing protein n=1 Tax=Lentinus tigrinus ALCF2SS1-6 TaxID=1328759 RepID=A0A5C2S3N7_9APHY|nr:hypothetical protein L227DRAFT_655089 [Lentinus tigrinus ALCF2SS1-6]RPD72215.1 hypothetical protein L226DRAFT_512047 [Lentinus tigrinus ALCF2SS1-7]